jgi:large conductance mechanosensitive channel
VFKGFRDFVLRGNVVDLAVAVVVGAAFGALVHAFVSDILTPIIAAIGGQPDFASLTFTVHNSTFHYGDFINAVISFVIIVAAIYYAVVVPVSRLTARSRPTPPSMRECPECLTPIPRQARRCAACSATVDPAA